MYNLYPKVKSIQYFDDCFFINGRLPVFFNKYKVNVFIKLKRILDCYLVSESNQAKILFKDDDSLPNEAYKLEIDKDQIVIYASSENGAYYAVVTLEQIIRNNNNNIKGLKIYDEPDLKVRGLMFDISRNKVASVNTIKNVLDMMESLKMNHFELYVEGFSFEYKSFKKYLHDEGYITVDEYRELEEYALERNIDFVPNVNGFGHMSEFLKQDEFKDLAECPDGIFLWGSQREASTLNPLDERSIQLVEKIYGDMLPFSKSKYFNMNFDEPFELGKGKSKVECDERGLGNVYIDYALKAYQALKVYGKVPLIWMDVLIKHPDLLYRLPKDMIFVDWGYDSIHSFDKNLKKLEELGTTYMSAPGTSSWCSFLGRTDEAFENISNAIKASIDHHALGSLLTDWGDFGHLQFLPVSYPPLVYFALLSWNNQEGQQREVKNYLNNIVFKDDSKLIADCIMDLGRYNRLENKYSDNGTDTFYSFMWGCRASKQADPISYFKEKVKYNLLNFVKYQNLCDFFDWKEKEIDRCKLKCDDGDVVIDELKCSIVLVRAIQKVVQSYNDELSLEEKLKLLDEAIVLKDYLYNERKRLWLKRNKMSDFEESFGHINEFFKFAKMTRKYISRGDRYEEEN